MSYTLLQKIFETKKARLAEAKRTVPTSELERRAAAARRGRMQNAFSAAVAQENGINIIAEIKRASPSKGAIKTDVDIEATAAAYERGGARAISVLTEQDHFRGSIGDLAEARRTTTLPILRKDFLFDEYQVLEAAAFGADAILLIAAMLADEQISSLTAAAGDLGLDPLVEVHTGEELRRVARVGARLIGVNNRNLHDFSVSLDVSRRLIGEAPPDALMITESGLAKHSEIVELHHCGFRGFLIGETLMRSSDPAGELRAFRGESR